MEDKLQVMDCQGRVHNIDVLNAKDFSSYNGVTRIILKETIANGSPMDIMTNENEDKLRERYSKLYDLLHE